MDYNKEIDNTIKSYYLGKLSEHELEKEINYIFKNSCELKSPITFRKYGRFYLYDVHGIPYKASVNNIFDQAIDISNSVWKKDKSHKNKKFKECFRESILGICNLILITIIYFYILSIFK
ncbi:hypothetical protein [Clostridium butyricum]|uniref:hypothetical protein n=1 Tax=Clostridium butyricum TaxID=1492 RepID=UPI00325B8FE9